MKQDNKKKKHQRDLHGNRVFLTEDEKNELRRILGSISLHDLEDFGLTRIKK